MTTPTTSARPTLMCYDGSDGAMLTLGAAATILGPRTMVVLTLWQTVSTKLSRTPGFASLTEFDAVSADHQEEQAARAAAEDGAARARAKDFDATARVSQAASPLWQSIIDVADMIDAELIVCGSSGRGAIEGALRGSTSRALMRHCRRPLLIAPQPAQTSG